MRTSSEVVVVRPGQALPDWWHASVFLAGPAGGPDELLPWQHEAVALLGRRWAGPGRLAVFVPELDISHEVPSTPGTAAPTDPTDWLDARVGQADVILFWGAGDPTPLSQAVTHLLWGRCENTGRAVLGLPADDRTGRYLRGRAERRRIPVAETLESTVGHAVDRITPGARRDGPHRDVPLTLWRTDSFRHWLDVKESSGHRLQQAQLAWNLPPRRHGGVFLWAVRPHLLINEENRVKKNEIVLGRTDVTSMVAYRTGSDLLETEIALVREFRSPAATTDGYVHELPGGSQRDDAPPAQIAAAEFGEETGLPLDPARLRYHGARQPVAALCAHRQHLFSAELDAAEVARLRTTVGTFGLADEGERTTVEVLTYRQILTGGLVDWTTLGLLSMAFVDIFGRPGVDLPLPA
ncbi:hypothetical protein ABZ436_23635 [Micromonospora matsumotoense]|uniref:hypothetical protein n=1 Tax=Micromonospora matsumotoense TaxID=121616 RepID=UPI003402F0A3